MSVLISLVGRPNVGKSSLFNRLLRRSAALVDDRPGVTRDRHYAPLSINGRRGLLVDTGGFDFSDLDPLAGPITAQIKAAMDQSDLVVLVTDGIVGLHPQDAELAELIRRSGRPSAVCVNKIDGPNRAPAAAEFYALGLTPVLPVSAAHGFGLEALRELLADNLEPEDDYDSLAEAAPPRVAVIGRPNAGKSSLINRLCGEERLVVNERPGTTRDTIDVEIQRGNRKYVLVDTAGVRRKGRVSEKLEKLSVMRAIKGIEGSDVAILVIDALEGASDQDAHIAGYAHERGRPLIVLINKWDAVKDRFDKRKDIQREMDLKMVFLDRAPFMTVSALTGAGLTRLWPAIDRIMDQYRFRASTSAVNRVIEKATEAHTPPQVGRVRLKFFYATQVSSGPPTFVIFVNRPESVHFSYRRFLANRLRQAFGLELVPVKLRLRDRHETGDSGRSPKKTLKTGPVAVEGVSDIFYGPPDDDLDDAGCQQGLDLNEQLEPGRRPDQNNRRAQNEPDGHSDRLSPRKEPAQGGVKVRPSKRPPTAPATGSALKKDSAEKKRLTKKSSVNSKSPTGSARSVGPKRPNSSKTGQKGTKKLSNTKNQKKGSPTSRAKKAAPKASQ
ncbi:MAG: ribosome biogenesis GTPase Der [Deltaproteobacteria bacterium]|jgi:GTP-binding protein|nr:ribosome biogenesis GTPase Der [Deltaproteobacteria bacterium]